MIDKEFNMLATLHVLEDGVGRRTFMKLLGAAGISLAMTPAVSRMAEAAGIIRGKIANQVSTPANDYWSVWTRAFATASDALGLEKQELFHQNDTARQLSQVRSLPASSARMLIGCVEPAGSLPAVAKFCEDNQIFYVPSWESPAWFTPPDIGDHYVSFVTPNSVEGAYEVSTSQAWRRPRIPTAPQVSCRPRKNIPASASLAACGQTGIASRPARSCFR
jgi:ribose transport system substrate-binding protein